MFNEEEEEEEEKYEENEENNNYRYFRRFWRIKRQFDQQNYIQTFNNNNNQIPSISAIINLNGVPQQTFPPPLPPSLSHQFLPTFPQYPQQQFIPQSPSDSQSIQMQLSNESTNSNNSFKNNNEFGRKKRKINS
uniref:Uncharacterized protein n=1 Tax=Meloidogyne enterolobii TaxID=390850 RepID=A0A6V7W6G9_MELEN|nr:unnamed protein product [Meloidogyne enterolobii]